MERVKLNGPPGTGKTSALVDICEQEMARGRAPWEIVFCSFTRAAAHEARDRAKSRFGGEDDDYRWFATEHSICYRQLGLTRQQVFTKKQLRAFGRRYNYDFTGEEDKKDSLEQRYQEGMLKSVADHYEFFVSYMRSRMLPFDAAYREFTGGNDIPDGFTKSGLESYIERRERYKQENHLWSFDDMIVGALERRLFPVGACVLILDEAQDCSPLLWELIKMWSKNVDSYYIGGDPLQTLYFWAGSSPDLFYSFPGDEQVLGHSYRLTRQVKEFAEQIVRRTSLPFPDFSPSDREGVVERQLLQSIDWDGAGDCFLLARTRWLISLFTDYFLSMGIPFTSERGHHCPLEMTKGRAFYSLFKLASGERVSNVELATLVKHTGAPFLARGAKKRVRNLVEGMYGLRNLTEMGFTDAFMSALRNGFEEILCRDIEGYERAYLLRVMRRYGYQAFEEPSKLTITTIHGSKGREKPTVYLCPDLTRRVWDGYARDRVPETLVYYVGATRAIDKLVVLTPQQRHIFPLPR